jgi:25S rRNA (uracil2634-N3)-methyltransferase
LPQGYAAEHSTLLVGDGDFSFACALCRLFSGDASRLVATTFDEEGDLDGKYQSWRAAAAEIAAAGGLVAHGIDATDLPGSLKALRRLLSKEASDGLLPPLFDRVVFNFPHRGEGVKDQAASVRSHQELLLRFFASALPCLAPGGEVLVTLKAGLPYTLWNVCKLASAGSGNALMLRTALPFEASAFPGYEHRRTSGDPRPKADWAAAEGGAEGGAERPGAKTYVWRRSGE